MCQALFCALKAQPYIKHTQISASIEFTFYGGGRGHRQNKYIIFILYVYSVFYED